AEQGANGGGGDKGPGTAPAPAAPAGAPAAQAAVATPSPAGVGGDGRVKASPIARRIAADRGLDLQGLSGSGPGGRIVKADVEQALAAGVAQAPQPAPEAPVAPAAPAGPTPGVSEKPETAKG